MDPVEIVNLEYQKLVSADGYSLRSFSKYLGIDPSTLSKILSGKRGIPKSHAIKFAQKLLESPEKRRQFIDAVLNYKSLDKVPCEESGMKLDENNSGDIFMIISQWEFFAILNVLKIKKFDHSTDFLARALNISNRRVNQCLDILQRNKFVNIKDGEIKRTAKKLSTTNDFVSRALKLAHIEELELAKNKMETDIDKKYYQSDVFTVAKSDIKKLKKIIERMYLDSDKLTDKSSPEEVYMLNCQLFPLTNCELMGQKTVRNSRIKNYEH